MSPVLDPDLAETMADVLSAMLGQEAEPTGEPMTPGPVAIARLAIHDQLTGEYTTVELEVSTTLAGVLTSRMMLMAHPADDDILDAVAELGNIAAGGIKSLIYKHARLSLPSAVIVAGESRSLAEAGHQVRAFVLGHVVQLTVVPNSDPNGLLWPPVGSDELLGRP